MKEFITKLKEAWLSYFRIRKVDIPDLLIISIIIFVSWCILEFIYGS